MSGRISLLHNGNTVRTAVYDKDSKKKAIIAKWKLLYGKAFNPDFLKDEPDKKRWKPKASKDCRNEFDNALTR